LVDFNKFYALIMKILPKMFHFLWRTEFVTLEKIWNSITTHEDLVWSVASGQL